MKNTALKPTEVWNLYELGKQYNMSLVPNQYNLVDTNIEFFIGNQWKGLDNSGPMATLPKPVFNIIKRVLGLFVASLTSTASRVSFEPLTNKQEGAPVNDPDPTGAAKEETAAKAAQMATDEVGNLFEKLNMDSKIREALFDGGQTGDYCAHFYWDPTKRPYGGAYGAYRGEICMELVDGINVMFGNPNTYVVEDQPYVIIVGRDTVENLRAEYLRYNKGKTLEAEAILPDKDYQYQAASGGKTELGTTDKTGKCTFLYYYTKKTKEVEALDSDGNPLMEVVKDKKGNPVPETMNGLPMYDAMGFPIYKKKVVKELVTTVYVSKHTRFLPIYDDIDTGLDYYPIAWGNWEHQKNQYHGRALVTGIIPNQIYINSMFALVMRHQQMLGFPKTLYDANIINQWNNTVGQAIAVYDLPPDKRMSDLYGVIQPADMSTQIMNCIDMAMQYTKECLGATDAQLGNVKPDNTSAIIALQSSSQVPLENPQSCKYDWIKDIGRILLDMMGTYYGERPVVRHVSEDQPVTDPTTGMPTSMTSRGKVVEMFDFSQLKKLWLNVRTDVGASTYWSRIAIVQTLDNLKAAGILDVLDYLERLPDEYIPRKEELLAKMRNQIAQQNAQGGAPDGPDLSPEAAQDIGDMDAAAIASMPLFTQEQFNNSTGRVQANLIRQAKQNALL